MEVFSHGLDEFAQCWEERTWEERLLHIAHRMELVRFWEIQEGMNVLEVGCGQGGTSFALALAVGSTGHVTAIDAASANYGTPPLGEVQGKIARSSIGKRITFMLSNDPVDPAIQFAEQSFDAVVLSHSSWYFSQPGDLLTIFRKSRTWARRLCFAEWDIIPRATAQIPHMLAVVLQVQLRALDLRNEYTGDLNVRSLITREFAQQMAQEAGWKIQKDTSLDSSVSFLDGKRYEMQMTQDLVNRMMQDRALPTLTRDLLRIEAGMLQTVTEDTRLLSLSTFAFCAG